MMNSSKNIFTTKGKRIAILPANLVLILAITLLASFSAKAQKNADLKGLWKMKVETSVGSGTPTFDLKHTTDSTVIGTYRGQLGETAIKGTVKLKAIHLEFSTSGNLIEYDGTVDLDSMKGSVKLGSMGNGTFMGTRSSK